MSEWINKKRADKYKPVGTFFIYTHRHLMRYVTMR